MLVARKCATNSYLFVSWLWWNERRQQQQKQSREINFMQNNNKRTAIVPILHAFLDLFTNQNVRLALIFINFVDFESISKCLHFCWLQFASQLSSNMCSNCAFFHKSHCFFFLILFHRVHCSIQQRLQLIIKAKKSEPTDHKLAYETNYRS